MPIVIHALQAEATDGQRALIDLGPKTLGYTNRMYGRFGRPRVAATVMSNAAIAVTAWLAA